MSTTQTVHIDDGLEEFRQILDKQAPNNSATLQGKRAELRNRFLNVLEYIANNRQDLSPIQLDFYRESSLPAGHCIGVDSNFSQLLVEDLQTHIGRVSTALIRVNDLTALTFPLKSK